MQKWTTHAQAAKFSPEYQVTMTMAQKIVDGKQDAAMLPPPFPVAVGLVIGITGTVGWIVRLTTTK